MCAQCNYLAIWADQAPNIQHGTSGAHSVSFVVYFAFCRGVRDGREQYCTSSNATSMWWISRPCALLHWAANQMIPPSSFGVLFRMNNTEDIHWMQGCPTLQTHYTSDVLLHF